MTGVRLDRVINIELPEAEIISRLTGRRICGACGAIFHLRFDPPKDETNVRPVPGRAPAAVR